MTAALCLLIARRGWLPGTVAIWGLSPGAASAMVLLADQHGADRGVVALERRRQYRTVKVTPKERGGV
jgi:uncharacterized membrane protein AbrB (regulator of aidB expression)